MVNLLSILKPLKALHTHDIGNRRVVPESARWLYTKNRHEEADEIVRMMARKNKVELPEDFKVNVTVKEPVISLNMNLLKAVNIKQ